MKIIIIIEGKQGEGKTTVANRLRPAVRNLIRSHDTLEVREVQK